MTRPTCRLATLLLLGLLPAMAPAKEIDFTFTNQGTGTLTAGCGLFCIDYQTTGNAVLYGLGSGSSGTGWSMDSVIHLSLFEGQTGPGVWSLADTSGDSLSGSFTMSLPSPSSGADLAMSYDVGGGTGLFSNAVGFGSSLVDYLPFTSTFFEWGSFSVNAGSVSGVSLPEPGVISLLAAGMLSLGLIFRRRRHATPATH